MVLFLEGEPLVMAEAPVDSFSISPSGGRDIGAQSTFSVHFYEKPRSKWLRTSNNWLFLAEKSSSPSQTSPPARVKQRYPISLLASLEERPRESVLEARGPKSWI
jgi:hypothetical protein